MVYYLGYYSCGKISKEFRIAPPPAMNKMGYIISVLSRIYDDKTLVVSPSETSLNKYVRGGLYELDNNVSIKTFGSIHSKNKIIRGIGHMLTKLQMQKFLMDNITSNDTLIVYHSLFLMKIVKKIKRLKKCRLIIEVEELYSDVKNDESLRKKELDYLQIADKYIMITELLNKEVNLQNKPRIISHGTYKTIQKYCEKIDDGKLHIVYAGSFNPIKGGACSAIDAAEFLDENFVMHILGKGTPADTEFVTKRIEQVSKKTSCCISFDGYKTGTEFDSFIQSCHIGLSTQQPDGKYNASSFPSKVLMYMSNGLPVVSVRIPAVATSKVGDIVYYYDVPSPQKIAEAIKSVPLKNDSYVREKLDALDEAFEKDFRDLLV